MSHNENSRELSRGYFGLSFYTASRGGLFSFGTRGRTRTGTGFTPGDFESPVSTNFTTLALSCSRSPAVPADDFSSAWALPLWSLLRFLRPRH
jgi:hypothetical protein